MYKAGICFVSSVIFQGFEVLIIGFSSSVEFEGMLRA